MIFAHLPAGYLLAQPFLSTAWKKFTCKQQYSLLAITAFSAIAPDLDFLYFYWVSSETFHRRYFSHSPFFYLQFLIVFFIIGRLKKSKFLQWIGGSIFLGAVIGHLLLDSINSGVMWLYPFSDYLFGLRGIHDKSLSLFGFHGSGFILLFEIIIIATAIIAATRQFLQNLTWRFIAYCIAILFITFSFSFLVLSKPYLYDTRYAFLADTDKDKLMNFEDADIDNDGVNNASDNDIDADGVNNLDDFLAAVKNMNGKFYDFYRGNFMNISKNIGFVAPTDILTYPLSQSGFFLSQRMDDDYKNTPQGYMTTPKNDPQFSENIENIAQFLKNQNFLVDRVERTIKAGDVFMFGVPLKSLAVVIDTQDPSHTILILAHPSQPLTHTLSLDEIVKREGPPQVIARIFP